MYKKVLFVAAMILFLLSCVDKKRTVEPADVLTDTVDSIAFVEDTIQFPEPLEPALPATGDETFEDFIYVFAADTLFQLSRIVFPLPYYKGENPLKIERKAWVHDAFFIKQPFYTLLFDSEQELDNTSDDTQSSVQVEWINMKTTLEKLYYFERIDGRWKLEAINERPIVKPKRAEFVDFFSRFATDSLYQKKHIREPLTFVTTDPDDDFSIIKTTLDTEQWFAFKPLLPDESLSNINYGPPSTAETPYKILQLKGIGNGFLNTLYFRQKASGKWELYKFEDTSN